MMMMTDRSRGAWPWTGAETRAIRWPMIVCEDQYTDVVANHLRGVAPDGRLYPFARLNAQTDLAGACFSPDGSTLFVNVYSPGKTLAITGPWAAFSA